MRRNAAEYVGEVCMGKWRRGHSLVVVSHWIGYNDRTEAGRQGLLRKNHFLIYPFLRQPTWLMNPIDSMFQATACAVDNFVQSKGYRLAHAHSAEAPPHPFFPASTAMRCVLDTMKRHRSLTRSGSVMRTLRLACSEPHVMSPSQLHKVGQGDWLRPTGR